MKALKLVFVFFFISQFFLSIASAYDLEGIIYDFDGNPLVDAMIRILDTQRFERGKDFTNRSGEYSITNIPGGTYTIEITKMGMDRVEDSVFVGGQYYEKTTYKDIRLNEIIRFESVSKSEMKGLYLLDESQIPRGAFSCYRKGMKKLSKNDLDDALEEFQDAIKKYPSFSRCYTHIGNIHTKKKEYEKARKSYLKAIELNSNDPMPLTEIGALLIELKEWKPATEYLTKACKMDPARADNYFLLGKAYYYNEKLDEAEKAFTQGLMIQPRLSGESRILLANIFMKKDRLTDAREMLNSYLRENPFANDKKEVKKRIREIENKLQLYQLPPME